MRAVRLGLGMLVVTILALPGMASAQRVVPPGNSAANQYTETYPTTGGNAVNEGAPPSSAHALGPRNAGRLEALGPDGRAAAALAAATAPSRAVAERGTAGQRGGLGSEGGKQADAPSGSSGLAEVLGQVTGSSSNGEMGLLLPLVIIATVVLSLASLLRRRRGSA